MRFQVPQFIEVESKIFGPLTFKQFVYLVGGGGIIFLLYAFLPFWLMIIPAMAVGAFSLALAFYKVNNQPFVRVVENAIKYFASTRLYLWKKEPPKQLPVKTLKKEAPAAPPSGEVYMPRLTRSKLKDLAWSLDIKSDIGKEDN